MTDGEAVLLPVRAGAGCGGGPGAEIGVAALADVPVATLAAALAQLDGLAGSGGSDAATTCQGWVLAPDDGSPAWPPDATLRTLDVLDGTPVVLRRLGSGGVSAARS